MRNITVVIPVRVPVVQKWRHETTAKKSKTTLQQLLKIPKIHIKIHRQQKRMPHSGTNNKKNTKQHKE